MSLLNYTGRDWTQDETTDGPRIVIPAPCLWPIAIFMGLWLTGWVAGETFAIKSLWEVYKEADSALALLPGAFLLFWLTGWTAGGLFALATALFSLRGREVVTLSGDTLLVRLETFMDLHWTWKLQVSGMTPPRIVTAEIPMQKLNPGPMELPAAPRKFAHILLQSGAKKWRLGMVMEESRAKDLLHTLNTRFGLPRGA